MVDVFFLLRKTKDHFSVALTTIFCSFCYFRDIKYPRLFVLATFSLLIEKISATFDFSQHFCQNRYEMKKSKV